MLWIPIITSVLLKKGGIAPYLWCVFMFLLLAIASSLRYYCATMLGERMILFMQRDIIAKLINFSPSFFSSRSHGDIFSTLVRDTERIKTTIGISMSIVLRNLLMAIGSMYMMFFISIDRSFPGTISANFLNFFPKGHCTSLMEGTKKESIIGSQSITSKSYKPLPTPPKTTERAYDG